MLSHAEKRGHVDTRVPIQGKLVAIQAGLSGKGGGDIEDVQVTAAGAVRRCCSSR